MLRFKLTHMNHKQTIVQHHPRLIIERYLLAAG